jgi:carbon storage regulator CsrA
MLVLSRKPKESVVVASADGQSCLVKVTIMEIRGERVRLGFQAKLDVPVHRWEVWQRIAEQRDLACNGASSGSGIPEATAAEGANQRRLQPGDLVRVNDGAFAGVEGTVIRCEACRVTVDVRLIEPGVSIEIDDHRLELIGERNGVAAQRVDRLAWLQSKPAVPKARPREIDQ